MTCFDYYDYDLCRIFGLVIVLFQRCMAQLLENQCLSMYKICYTNAYIYIFQPVTTDDIY